MKKDIISTDGDREGKIDDLINFLTNAKLQGATHYEMEWSNDVNWAFKWFKAYKVMTPEDIKNEEIDKLKMRLKELGGL